MKIKIGEKEYSVEIAETEEEKEKGLQDSHYLPEDEGMLFIYENSEDIGFWMKDTFLPLDIIFINDDLEVISIAKGVPESEDVHEEQGVKYVLELNEDSGVKVGDELSFVDDNDNPTSKMLVLDENGDTQLELDGGERIFSRKNTKTLIKLSARAYKSKKDSNYKSLGRKIFQYLKEQDERDVEYVEVKEK